jgi:hypothetical protein
MAEKLLVNELAEMLGVELALELLPVVPVVEPAGVVGVDELPQPAITAPAAIRGTTARGQRVIVLLS